MAKAFVKHDYAVTGKDYVETDGGGDTPGGGGIDYSQEEQDTGLKWIDGKNIYQVTLVFENVSSGRNQINHGISDIDSIVDFNGVFDIGSGGWYRKAPESGADSYWVGVSGVNSTQIDYRYGASWGIAANLTITIWYTKTE